MDRREREADHERATVQLEATVADDSFQARQGDVLLVAIRDLPTGVARVPLLRDRVVLAEGEATGHAHVVKSGKAHLFEDPGGARYLRTFTPVSIGHEEHAAINVPEGTYRVVIQREYAPDAPSARGWRQVRD